MLAKQGLKSLACWYCGLSYPVEFNLLEGDYLCDTCVYRATESGDAEHSITQLAEDVARQLMETNWAPTLRSVELLQAIHVLVGSQARRFEARWRQYERDQGAKSGSRP